MYKLFISTPMEFKKHCIETDKYRQEELEKLITLRDNYITDISSKRKEYNDKYQEYLLQFKSTKSYIDKVRLFRESYPTREKNYDIYSYKSYPLKTLNGNETV